MGDHARTVWTRYGHVTEIIVGMEGPPLVVDAGVGRDIGERVVKEVGNPCMNDHDRLSKQSTEQTLRLENAQYSTKPTISNMMRFAVQFLFLTALSQIKTYVIVHF